VCACSLRSQLCTAVLFSCTASSRSVAPLAGWKVVVVDGLLVRHDAAELARPDTPAASSRQHSALISQNAGC
jgi:hypothetical protein